MHNVDNQLIYQQANESCINRSKYYMFLNKMRKIVGFTLAEVLITLGIIGVVAAMTIPALVNYTNDLELKTAWKNDFSTLNQATISMLQDNGGTFAGAFPASYTDGAKWFATQYTSYLNYTHYCPTCGASNDHTCWHPDTSFATPTSTDASKLTYLYGSPTYNSNVGGYPGIIMTNGSLLLFHSNNNPDCTGWYANLTCASILVDVNGFKAPNTLGRDIFQIWITSQGIKPAGYNGDISTDNPSTTCVDGSTASTNTGFGCAAKYLYQ